MDKDDDEADDGEDETRDHAEHVSLMVLLVEIEQHPPQHATTKFTQMLKIKTKHGTKTPKTMIEK